jgi:hypothetical protein
MCDQLEDAADQTPPDKAAIADLSAQVRQRLEALFKLRKEFARSFNETEQEHALRIDFRRGRWQEVVAADPSPEGVADFVHNVRLGLHGEEFYDYLDLTFFRKKKRGKGWDEVPYEDLTPSQRSLMALRLLLNSSRDMAPVFIDAPERWLDNESLLEFHDLRRIRDDQLILFTENPNIAVLGNAEQTVILNVERGRTKVVARGGLDKKLEKRRRQDEHKYLTDETIRLLEGGTHAFQRKLLRYQAELRRLGLRVELQRPEKT